MVEVDSTEVSSCVPKIGFIKGLHNQIWCQLLLCSKTVLDQNRNVQESARGTHAVLGFCVSSECAIISLPRHIYFHLLHCPLLQVRSLVS